MAKENYWKEVASSLKMVNNGRNTAQRVNCCGRLLRAARMPLNFLLRAAIGFTGITLRGSLF
jgi:hypothetical protein